MKRHPHEKAVGIVDKMEEMSTRAERSDWVLLVVLYYDQETLK